MIRAHALKLRRYLGCIVASCLMCVCPSTSWASMEREALSKGISHYIMGMVHDFEGQTEQAVEEFKEAAKFDYTSYAIHLRIGANYARLGKIDEAIEELKLASQLNPEDLQPHYLLALIYSSQQDFIKAAEEYESILRHYSIQDPENTQVYKYLAQLYYSQGKLDKAIEQYQKILSIEPKNAEVMYLLGSLYLETEDRARAVELFKEAIKIDPEHEGSLNSLGYVYAEDSVNLDEALDLIKRALAVSPDNGAYLDSLGWVYYKKGMFKEALEQLIKASEQFEDPLIYEHMGDVYFKLNQIENASKYWQLSLKLLPDQEHILKKLETLKVGKNSTQ